MLYLANSFVVCIESFLSFQDVFVLSTKLEFNCVVFCVHVLIYFFQLCCFILVNFMKLLFQTSRLVKAATASAAVPEDWSVGKVGFLS